MIARISGITTSTAVLTFPPVNSPDNHFKHRGKPMKNPNVRKSIAGITLAIMLVAGASAPTEEAQG